MITVKQLWEALDSGHPYEDLAPDELSRLDKAHAEFIELFQGENRRQVLCYVEHKSWHAQFVTIDQDEKTFEFHDSALLHMVTPESQRNNLETIELLKNLAAIGYTQVL